MQAIVRKIFSYKLLPVAWTILIVFLLCIPGSYVPGNGLFGIEGLDKVVHVALFGSHVLFWGWHFRTVGRQTLRKVYTRIVIATILFGVVMELVQMYLIPNRSFDGYDIVANAVGAVAAGFWLMRT